MRRWLHDAAEGMVRRQYVRWMQAELDHLVLRRSTHPGVHAEYLRRQRARARRHASR